MRHQRAYTRRFTTYARSLGLTPAAVPTGPRQNADFVCWVSTHAQNFRSLHQMHRFDPLSLQQQEDFDAYLEAQTP